MKRDEAVVSSERGGELDETTSVAAALAKFKEREGRPARPNGHEGGTDVVFDARRRRHFFLDGNGNPVWIDCPPTHRCNADGELEPLPSG
jgi:hypothetical protein